MSEETNTRGLGASLWRWLKPDATGAEEVEGRRRLLHRLVRVMYTVGAIAMVTALIDGAANRMVTVAWYLPVFLGIYLLGQLVRRVGVVQAGLVISLFFWLLVALTTLLFGGMLGQTASTFVVSVMLIGGTVGGRAPVVVAVASSAWCLVLVVLESTGHLPRSLVPYRPINAWSAVTVALVLAAVLLRSSLDIVRALNARVELAARERDEALRRSLQMQKMELVGNLTSGIAHDFNNLLTVISSTSQHLRGRTAAEDSSARDSLDDLDGATERAALITRQLLAFGRGGSGEAPKPVEVGEVVRPLVTLLPRLLGPNIRIRLAVDEGAVVRASRAGLEQVLLNLAVNARDAMPDGGILDLAVRVEGSDVVLSVVDTGVGMDAATQARIFEPFYTTKAAGTGLGLATVRELVNRFDGRIAVESAPGRGSRFVVRFPRSDEPASAPAAPARRRAPARSARERLLLVDDDPLVRRAARRDLEAAGFEVVPLANAREALCLLRDECAFSVVVTDVAMPGPSGDELANQLATLHPELPVVLFSGHHAYVPADPPMPRRAFVAKPARRDELLAAIARARGDGV